MNPLLPGKGFARYARFSPLIHQGKHLVSFARVHTAILLTAKLSHVIHRKKMVALGCSSTPEEMLGGRYLFFQYLSDGIIAESKPK